MRLRRVIWFLVIALALLVVVMMFTVGSRPHWLRSTPFLGAWLGEWVDAPAER